MKQEELARLSDEELLSHARNNKPNPIFDAFFIGFLIGIIIFGVAVNAMGWLMLVPLFLIYLFLKKPKQHAALQAELKKLDLTLDEG